MTAVLATLMVAGAMHGAPVSGTAAQSDDTCVIVRVSAEGRRTVIDEDHPDHDRYLQTSTRHGGGGTHASASSSGSSSNSASSSVSVSSSSRNGRSTSSATARDEDGERTVTTTRDHNGCTTVVDERPAQRSDR